jgi:hypothetical protein
MNDLFGTPKHIFEDEIEKLKKELKAEKAKTKQFERLYNAVNNMLAELGANGEICSLDPKVEIVMDVLFDIDGGSFKEMSEG